MKWKLQWIDNIAIKNKIIEADRIETHNGILSFYKDCQIESLFNEGSWINVIREDE